MMPRVVTRTHYQIDEPALLYLLVTECARSNKGAYREQVADALVRAMRDHGALNRAAAGYAVDAARAVDLLTESMVWTPKGQLVGLFSAREGSYTAELSREEQIMTFRLFLHSDGAALWYLSDYVETHGVIPSQSDDWNAVANAMMLRILEEYLQLVAEPASRLRIRQALERRRRKQYSGKSGSHQLFLHLQVMHRIGLLERADVGNARRYVATRENGRPSKTQELLSVLPSIRAVEEAASSGGWLDVATALWKAKERCEQDDESVTVSRLLAFYDRVCATGVDLCPISTITDAMQISQIAESVEATGAEEAMEILKALQRERPRELRFHVDRFGRPAYIRIDNRQLT